MEQPLLVLTLLPGIITLASGRTVLPRAVQPMAVGRLPDVDRLALIPRLSGAQGNRAAPG
jgi:hypothetical protein